MLNRRGTQEVFLLLYNHNRGNRFCVSSLLLSFSFFIFSSSPRGHATRTCSRVGERKCLNVSKRKLALFPLPTLVIKYAGRFSKSIIILHSVSSILFIVLAVRLINPSSRESAIPKEVKRASFLIFSLFFSCFL